MPVYSQDLRKRVLDTVERGDSSLRQIAQRFLVSLSFVVRLLQHYRTTGSLEPKPHGGGRPPALSPAQLKRLATLIRKKPDATLEELRQSLGVHCSTMAIVRALKKLKITRKKKVLHAQERDTPEGQQKRRDFLEGVAGVDPKRLVFVDESGATTSMTRTYGRAPVGERVHGAVPGHWDAVALICGLRLSGVTAPVVFQGATDTPAFQSYVEQVLVPELQSEDVVIWDNLQPHKAAAVVAAVEQAGARVVPLPPSSPDLTPIEEMFSKVKGALRSAAARSTVAISAAIGSALHDVSQQDIWGWFQSRAAYAMQS
jgi:transposase